MSTAPRAYVPRCDAPPAGVGVCCPAFVAAAAVPAVATAFLVVVSVVAVLIRSRVDRMPGRGVGWQLHSALLRSPSHWLWLCIPAASWMSSRILIVFNQGVVVFVVYLVSVRSGSVPVAVTDSVLVPVAGSGLASVLRSVFNRTPERTPCSVSHRWSGRLSALLACPAIDPAWSRVSPPGAGIPYRRGGGGWWMIRFFGSSPS